jgi:hypothetical protein
MDDLGAPQVGDNATSDTNDVCRRCTEVVVPRSRSSPHLVVLQQVGINKHAQLCAVTKGRHATVGLGNLGSVSIKRREKQFDINVCLSKNSAKSSSLDFTM